MGTTTSAVYSDEQMLACIDPVKKHNMSTRRRITVETLLDFRLFSSRGSLRSEFPQITYSDYVNLLNYASQYTKFPNSGSHYPLWVELVEELQSIVKEYESKKENSDLADHSQVPDSRSKRNLRTGSDGTGIGDDRIPFPIPVPVPSAEQIIKGSYQNSGEQHLRGLINNQTGYVSGNGNGSYFVSVLNDCTILLENGKKETNR